MIKYDKVWRRDWGWTIAKERPIRKWYIDMQVWPIPLLPLHLYQRVARGIISSFFSLLLLSQTGLNFTLRRLCLLDELWVFVSLRQQSRDVQKWGDSPPTGLSGPPIFTSLCFISSVRIHLFPSLLSCGGPRPACHIMVAFVAGCQEQVFIEHILPTPKLPMLKRWHAALCYLFYLITVVYFFLF